MKKNYFKLIVLIIFTSNSLSGQYIPLVEEGKFWIYQNHQDLDFPTPISGHAYTFLGDTTINSLTYKKVYKLNLKGEHNCAATEWPCWDFDLPYQTESRELVAFIREDTLEKKVYKLPTPNGLFCETDEDLLFDFSLSVGDTLNTCLYETIWSANANLSPGGIVDSIKVVETHGKLRNTIFTYGFYFTIGLPHETEILISEGIGYRDHGLVNKPKSGFADYCEGEIDQCNLILSTKLIQSEKEINIFPNPSKGEFQLSIGEEKLESIRVFSFIGQLKKEIRFSNKIDLSNFESGVYFIEIITKDNDRIIKKVIKEN